MTYKQDFACWRLQVAWIFKPIDIYWLTVQRGLSDMIMVYSKEILLTLKRFSIITNWTKTESLWHKLKLALDLAEVSSCCFWTFEILIYWNQTCCWEEWRIPVILAAQEAEAGEWQVLGQLQKLRDHL